MPSLEDVKVEVDIALGRKPQSQIAETFAYLAPLACGGVFSEIKRPPLRFRCQVGYSYTAEALVSKAEGSPDEAIRVALRIIEERAWLSDSMADDARKRDRGAAATSYERRANECRAHGEVLRCAIGQT